MVLDKLVNPKLLRTQPIRAAPMGFFFVLVGFVSTLFVFSSQVSIVMVALSSLLMLPYVLKISEFDELDVDIDDTSVEELGEWVRKCLKDGYTPQQIKDNLIRDNLDKPYDLLYDLAGVDKEYMEYATSSNFLTRHRQTIYFYVYLFLGATLAFMFLYAVLDENLLQFAFYNQLDVIMPSPRGMFTGGALFQSIVLNNLRIALICVILSLFYGSGAVFILTYNASIAGVMYGSSFRGLIWGSEALYPNILAYLPHTTLEILAYLLAAISGGILSKATIGSNPGCVRFWVKDSLILLATTVALILAAGWLETQVLM